MYLFNQQKMKEFLLHDGKWAHHNPDFYKNKTEKINWLLPFLNPNTMKIHQRLTPSHVIDSLMKELEWETNALHENLVKDWKMLVQAYREMAIQELKQLTQTHGCSLNDPNQNRWTIIVYLNAERIMECIQPNLLLSNQQPPVLFRMDFRFPGMFSVENDHEYESSVQKKANRFNKDKFHEKFDDIHRFHLEWMRIVQETTHAMMQAAEKQGLIWGEWA